MFDKAFLVDGVQTISVEDLTSLPQALLIDVRRDDEFVGELGHIKGSKLITLGPELETFIKSLNNNQTVIFICRSGARSASATLFAQNLGLKNVYNMQGGMISWNQKGKEVSFNPRD
jgi:rhodanese-related sulfurtransferase